MLAAQDIEGFEFSVLSDIMAAQKLIPSQIALEVHWRNVPPSGKHKSGADIARFRDMLQASGYYMVDRHDNERCTHCTELLLARIGCNDHK